jgi:hypothetical protein
MEETLTLSTLLGLEFAFRVDGSRADALHDDTDCERFLVGGACES